MEALSSFPYHGDSLPLEFTVDPRKTKMYGGLGDEAFEFAMNNFTYNGHYLAVAPETFTNDKGLSSFWDVTALSQLPNGSYFVASIESKSYPIMATQFHPEKPSELWTDTTHVNHSYENIQVSEHFSKLFVTMARANKNTYGSYADYMKLKLDISNFKIMDTEWGGPIYVFE
jgi:gamma-glutamyl hydrolase